MTIPSIREWSSDTTCSINFNYILLKMNILIEATTSEIINNGIIEIGIVGTLL